jgi:hypothetical protein
MSIHPAIRIELRGHLNPTFTLIFCHLLRVELDVFSSDQSPTSNFDAFDFAASKNFICLGSSKIQERRNLVHRQ